MIFVFQIRKLRLRVSHRRRFLSGSLSKHTVERCAGPGGEGRVSQISCPFLVSELGWSFIAALFLPNCKSLSQGT